MSRKAVHQYDSLGQVLEEFRQRRIDAAKNGSERTGNRYVYESVRWAAWLNEERDRWVWEADYYDLVAQLQEMKRSGYSVSQRKIQTAAISKFYQECAKLADNPDYSLPEGAARRYDDDNDIEPNPRDKIDDDDRDKYLKGDTEKSKGVQSEDEIYYLETDEISKLVDNAPAPKLRNEMVLKLLFDTGTRREELAQVKLSHIDRDEHTIYIPPMKSSQGRKVTYTPDYVGFQLDQWLDYGYRDAQGRADESPYLLPTNESEHLSGDRINTIVKEAAEKAGLQKVVAEYVDGREIHKVSAHTIRHSHAVCAINSGIDVRRLAESLGHISKDGTANIETTMTYLRLAEKDYIKESRKFNPV